MDANILVMASLCPVLVCIVHVAVEFQNSNLSNVAPHRTNTNAYIETATTKNTMRIFFIAGNIMPHGYEVEVAPALASAKHIMLQF